MALEKNLDNSRFGTDEMNQKDVEVISGVSSEVVKEVLIPEIEKEVNEGENFANLRQIYSSMILATWYKKNLRETLLGQVYVDQNKNDGVAISDIQANQKIYEQYLKAFKVAIDAGVGHPTSLQARRGGGNGDSRQRCAVGIFGATDQGSSKRSLTGGDLREDQ